MKKKVLVGVAATLVIVFTSFMSASCCSLLSIGSDSGKIESFPTASAIEGKTILYSDDFSKPGTDWDLGSWENGGADYSNGSYLVQVPSENNIFAYLHKSFPKDIIMEVDVSRVNDKDTSKDLWAGFIVRHTDDDSGYLIEIHNDKGTGVANIGAMTKGLSHNIDTINNHWKWPSDWSETYHVRIDAIGDQISLYINGYLVQSATDSTINSDGGIGFFGGRDNYGERQYLFDNLVVYAADQEGNAVTKQTTANAETDANLEGEVGVTESSGIAEEAPTIKLVIIEGPTLEGNIYYYRVEAIVTGSPDPEVSFSKDDSRGAWGSKKVQINLNSPGETYTLEATATNSGGTAADSIKLSW